MYEIRHYLTADNKDLFLDWLRQVRDPIAKVQIVKRITRVEQGNFGDHKSCRDGFGKCGLMSAQATACTTLKLGRGSFCCCAAAISVPKMQTLIAQCAIGRIGNGGQTMKVRAHDDAMAELFREDSAFATQYLNDILEDGDQSDLLIALRQVAKAFGGVSAIAEKAHLNPTQLYRTLPPEGNPELRSLTAVLKAMGLRLSVQPLHHA